MVIRKVLFMEKGESIIEKYTKRTECITVPQHIQEVIGNFKGTCEIVYTKVE